MAYILYKMIITKHSVYYKIGLYKHLFMYSNFKKAALSTMFHTFHHALL